MQPINTLQINTDESFFRDKQTSLIIMALSQKRASGHTLLTTSFDRFMSQFISQRSFLSVSRCWRRRSSGHSGRWNKQSADHYRSSGTSRYLRNSKNSKYFFKKTEFMKVNPVTWWMTVLPKASHHCHTVGNSNITATSKQSMQLIQYTFSRVRRFRFQSLVFAHLCWWWLHAAVWRWGRSPTPAYGPPLRTKGHCKSKWAPWTPGSLRRIGTGKEIKRLKKRKEKKKAHGWRLLHWLNLMCLPRYLELDSESSVLKSNGINPSKWLSLSERRKRLLPATAWWKITYAAGLR